MQKCSTKGCEGLMHTMYCGFDSWKRVCPVCRASEDVQGPVELRKYDEYTAKGYTCCADEQLPLYPEAETWFFAAADVAETEEDRLFCLWWGLLCRYGVAYTREVTYPDFPPKTSNIFTAAFGRFPLPDYCLRDCEAYEYIRHSTDVSRSVLIRMLDVLADKLTEIERHMEDNSKLFPLFIAWHNRSVDDKRCQMYAKKLVSALNAENVTVFFSENIGKGGVLPENFEAPIYAALASASIMVVVTDDMSALDEGHMGMEVRRFQTRKMHTKDCRILVCAMKGYVNASKKVAGIEWLSSKCDLDDDFRLMAKRICDMKPRVLLSTEENNLPMETVQTGSRPMEESRKEKPHTPVVSAKMVAVLLACLLTLVLMLMGRSKPVSETSVPEVTAATALPETQPPTTAPTETPAGTPTPTSTPMPAFTPAPTGPIAAVYEYFQLRQTDGNAPAPVSASGTFPSFLPEQLLALPLPDPMDSLAVTPFYDQDGTCLLEVTYADGPRSICAWMAAEYTDRWQLTGALLPEDTGSNMDRDSSISLLCLNREVTRTLSSKGNRHSYRVIVPCSGRLALIWQSGQESAPAVSHTVTLNSGSLAGEELFSFPLKPNPNKQATQDRFVQAGVYYVSVTAANDQATPYTLNITFTPDEHVELESNDIAAEATPIEPNTPWLGCIDTAKDVDFFRFTLKEHSMVNVSFAASGSGKQSTAWVYAIHSAADGQQQTAVSVSGQQQLAQTGNLYLLPGDYLVQTICGTTHIAQPYTLTVNAEPAGSAEAEPNNTRETATLLPVNTDMTGSFVQAGDTDCFCFTLEQPALVQPKLTFQSVNSSAKTYTITIADSNGREHYSESIKGQESGKRLVPAALPAGSYTLVLTNPSFVRQDYTLRLICQTVSNAETEPNNTPALATPLALGQSCTGVITTKEDVDCYQLVFGQTTTVRLKFSFQQGTASSTAFTLSVVRDGETLRTWNVKLDSGGLEQLLEFPAGEYQIRLKPSTWWSAPYTISADPV